MEETERVASSSYIVMTYFSKLSVVCSCMVNLLMCSISPSPNQLSYIVRATTTRPLLSQCGRISLRKVIITSLVKMIFIRRNTSLFFFLIKMLSPRNCFVELESTGTAPLQTRMNTLSNKLIALGRMYGGTERYFPLRKLMAVKLMIQFLLSIETQY